MRDCCQSIEKEYTESIKEGPICDYAIADVGGGAQMIESRAWKFKVQLISGGILYDTKIFLVHSPTIAIGRSQLTRA